MVAQDALDPRVIEAQRETQRTIERLQSDRAIDDMRWLMGEPAGRRIMHGLLAETKVWTGGFTPDPNLLQFREGRRALGLGYLAVVQGHCPDDFIKMLQEGQNNVA